jgi:ATP-dependent NAD(P)H-hydrate dehydratase|eukprot:g8185.t1
MSRLASSPIIRHSAEVSTAIVNIFAEHCIPALTPDKYKGQCGRIGVMGGSETYVGAPFYAGNAALKGGADLVYLFTAEEAVLPIKTFSPELMVEPSYRCINTGPEQSPQVIAESVVAKLGRLHSLCIGPGLGRHQHVFAGVKEVIRAARGTSTPLVIDADGLFLVTQDIRIIQGNQNVVLTPNIVEFMRLCKVFNVDVPPLPYSLHLPDWCSSVETLATLLGNVTVVLKGEKDILSNGLETCVVHETGGLRRSGGQGDVLAGIMTLACAWSAIAPKLPDSSEMSSVLLAAGVFASTVTKRVSRISYNEHGRSMGVPDMFSKIGPVIEAIAPAPKVEI